MSEMRENLEQQKRFLINLGYNTDRKEYKPKSYSLQALYEEFLNAPTEEQRNKIVETVQDIYGRVPIDFMIYFDYQRKSR